MLAPLYSPLPITVERAEGVRLFTDRGEFLDCYSGIGVMAMGHSYGPTLKAIEAKAGRHLHLGNYFLDPDALSMAEAVLALDGRDGQVAFSNSGAEATEAAIKAVKALRPGKIISFKGNFHGRTCGSLSITWGPGIRKPFEPLLSDGIFLPLSGECLRLFCEANEVAAVFLETVQGNSGILPCSEDLAETIHSLHEEGRFLLVADEIQSGLGRTGKGYGYRHYGLKPDLVTLGKGLGGGLPLGALLAFGCSPFAQGEHGSTFAPNPLSLAAGLPVLRAMTDDFLSEVIRKGRLLSEGLKRLPWVDSVRGLGLMIGAVTKDANTVRQAAFDRGALLNVAGGAIRFLPALNVTDDEIEEMLDKLNFSI
jgi:acetylornithine/N-succinyldiaminopimelate aminotransferase